MFDSNGVVVLLHKGSLDIRERRVGRNVSETTKAILALTSQVLEIWDPTKMLISRSLLPW